FVADRRSKKPATPDETLQIVREAVARGVILMRAGLYSNCVRFLPPLVMPEDMLREGLEVVGGAIEAVSLRHAGTPACARCRRARGYSGAATTRRRCANGGCRRAPISIAPIRIDQSSSHAPAVTSVPSTARR